MNQQNSNSNSILLQFFSGLLNGCGRLFLVCIVVGVPIALPSFLTWADNVKQSEAKAYVDRMNRGQQAHFADKSAFTNSIDALDINIETETISYKYSIRTTEKAAFNYGVAKYQKLKSYVGGVFVDANATKDVITTRSIFCESDAPGTIKLAEPIYQSGELICGKGTTELTR